MSFRLIGEGKDFDGLFIGANGDSDMVFTKADILRAATLTGRTRTSAKRFGAQSRLETRWRLSAIQLALDLEPPPAGTGPKLFRHPAQWWRLDRSEKAALNFTLGSVVAKLVAERLLNTPLLLHHDVYSHFLRTDLRQRDPRPDFAGWTNFPNARWVAIEAKGRSQRPFAPDLSGAKFQATALRRVRNETVSCHATCWAYERSRQIFAFYEDPPPPDDDGLTLDIDPWQFGAAYYAPLRAMLEVAEPGVNRDEFITYRVPSLDVKLALHRKLDGIVREPNSRVMEHFMELLPIHDVMAGDFLLGPDGVAILPADTRLGDTEGESHTPQKK
ncbi:MAG: hypothetical protein ABMA13_19845 [Chthoniobacteraceae bacterium]